MAMQADNPAGAPSAQVVGNAFVEQYYQILHQSPELVYRFYQDSSVLSRPDTNGVMASVTTMRGINDKILSMNYMDYLAEIKTADAQQSFGEGVLVLVTGCLTGKDNVRKKFAQSFFLAPQEKGFFVLNDVFRYVDENELVAGTPVSTGAAADSSLATSVVPVPVKPNDVPEHSGTLPEPPLVEDADDGVEVCDPSDGEELAVEDEVAEPPVHPSRTENNTVGSVSSVPEGDAPKKSYASIVKYRKASPPPTKLHASPNNVKATSLISEQQSCESEIPAPVLGPIVHSAQTAPESSNVEGVILEGHSVYVRNLPLNATPTLLEQAFKIFGSIKQGGIQVRSNKQQGFCYGFVEFESLDSMAAALEASPIPVGNRKAVVEEKRTTTRVGGNTSGSTGRGRYPSGGRGGAGFRSDSFRGHGNYGGGGRGYGRGGQGEYFPRNRRVLESYQRVDHSGAGRGGRVGGGGSHQQGGPE